MSLRDKIASIAKEQYGIPDVKRYLKEQYWDLNVSTADIGKKFGCKENNVVHFMNAEGIPLKAPKGGKYFLAALKEHGYADMNDFFVKNCTKTKMDMSRDLGVSFGSICQYYSKWAVKNKK